MASAHGFCGPQYVHPYAELFLQLLALSSYLAASTLLNHTVPLRPTSALWMSARMVAAVAVAVASARLRSPASGLRSAAHYLTLSSASLAVCFLRSSITWVNLKAMSSGLPLTSIWPMVPYLRGAHGARHPTRNTSGKFQTKAAALASIVSSVFSFQPPKIKCFGCHAPGAVAWLVAPPGNASRPRGSRSLP